MGGSVLVGLVVGIANLMVGEGVVQTGGPPVCTGVDVRCVGLWQADSSKPAIHNNVIRIKTRRFWVLWLNINALHSTTNPAIALVLIFLSYLVIFSA